MSRSGTLRRQHVGTRDIAAGALVHRAASARILPRELAVEQRCVTGNQRRLQQLATLTLVVVLVERLDVGSHFAMAAVCAATPGLCRPAETCTTAGREVVTYGSHMTASKSEVGVPVAIDASTEVIDSVNELTTDVESTRPVANNHLLAQLLLEQLVLLL